MRRVFKVVCTLLFAVFIIGLVPQTIINAKTVEVKLTGKMAEVFAPAADEYYQYGKSKLIKVKPTLKKDSKGVYTLTLYDNTSLRLKVTVPKTYTADGHSKGPVKVGTSAHNTVQLDVKLTNKQKKAQKTVKQTVYLQARGREEIGNTGMYKIGKYTGKKTKLNVVIKPLPDLSKEIIKLLKAEMGNVTNPELTEFDKAWLAFDWIVDNIKYAENSHTKYGNTTEDAIAPTLRERKGVCGEMSILFQKMCNILGLECKSIIEVDLDHAWNEVKIDGKWYVMDASDGTFSKEIEKKYVLDVYPYEGDSSDPESDTVPWERYYKTLQEKLAK